jgi:hypothetical protein
MKTLLVASLALAAMVAAPVTAAGQSPGTDSVIGTASDCTEPFELDGQIFCARRLNITVDVESGPVGENPTGAVVLNSIGGTPVGSISTDSEATCLSVSGRVAIIGLAGQASIQFFPSVVAGLVRIVDAGGLDSGSDTFEFAYQSAPAAGPPLPGPTSCSTFPGTFGRDPLFFPDFTNETGDVVVTDAQPFPTSKDQCKNGGWRNFPQFKNEGQCIAFVNHGP